MSRPLFTAVLAAFVLVALAPLAAMLPRIEPADLARIFELRVASLFLRTLGLGLGAAALALLLGVPFGFLVARTDLPGRDTLRTLGVVPLLLPPLFLAMTWTVLTDWHGMQASIWVLGLSGFPLVAIFAARAAERVDARLEEAARVAGGRRAALRVDLALVLPPALAGACLAFVFAVNDFSVPDYVSSVTKKFNVYADEIFASWMQVERPGLAVAMSLPLIALNLAALVPALLLQRSGSLASIQSGFQPPPAWRLHAWRWPAFAFALGIVTLAALAPIARLGYESGGGPRHFNDARVAEVLAEREGAPLDAQVGVSERVRAAPALIGASLAQARAAFRTAIDRSRGDLQRSFRHALIAATLAVIFGLVLGHGIERMRSRTLGRTLELASLLPLAAPATLFGIGAIALWARPATQDFYQSDWMPALLYAGRLGAFAVLITSGAIASLDRSLEDATAVAGVGPIRRLGTIVAPLIKGPLLGSWALVFAFAMRELDAAILVPAANRTAIVRVYNGVHFGRDDFVAALALVLVLSVLLPGIVWSVFTRRRMEVLP